MSGFRRNNAVVESRQVSGQPPTSPRARLPIDPSPPVIHTVTVAMSTHGYFSPSAIVHRLVRHRVLWRLGRGDRRNGDGRRRGTVDGPVRRGKAGFMPTIAPHQSPPGQGLRAEPLESADLAVGETLSSLRNVDAATLVVFDFVLMGESASSREGREPP